MPTLEELLLEMLQTAPDPNEPLPVSNRKETIYGAVITFLVGKFNVAILSFGLKLTLRTDCLLVSRLLARMGAPLHCSRPWLGRLFHCNRICMLDASLDNVIY